MEYEETDKKAVKELRDFLHDNGKKHTRLKYLLLTWLEDKLEKIEMSELVEAIWQNSDMFQNVREEIIQQRFQEHDKESMRIAEDSKMELSRNLKLTIKKS